MKFWVTTPMGASAMVVDSSALLAVLFGEEDSASYIEALAAGERKYISSLNLFEAAVVVEARKGENGAKAFTALTANAELEVLPFDASQAEIALAAWRRFGRGRHPAGLNLGDCAAYALAITLNERLLFKGTGFTRTDVAIYPAVSGNSEV